MNQRDLITQAEQHLSSKLRSLHPRYEVAQVQQPAEVVVSAALEKLTGVSSLTQSKSGMVTVHYSNGSVRRGLYPHPIDDRTDPMRVVDCIVNGGDD